MVKFICFIKTFPVLLYRFHCIFLHRGWNIYGCCPVCHLTWYIVIHYMNNKQAAFLRLSLPWMVSYCWICVILSLIFVRVVITAASRDRRDVSNHWPLDCLFKRLSKLTSKETSKVRITGICEGIPWWPVDSHSQKGQLCRKRFHVMASSW